MSVMELSKKCVEIDLFYGVLHMKCSRTSRFSAQKKSSAVLQHANSFHRHHNYLQTKSSDSSSFSCTGQAVTRMLAERPSEVLEQCGVAQSC